MPATLRAVTLGCKVNQYETEYVREALLGAGYRDACDGEPADVCVVNTCTVTATGDAKSRKLIRRLAKENPESRIIVMGCYATRAPAEVAALPGVAEVVTDKRSLPDLLDRFGVTEAPEGISGFGDRRRAYIKVQDGCMLRCSYCIVPSVRPHLVSRPIERIFDEVCRLRDNGYRELVLTGVHLGHFGVDWPRGGGGPARMRLAVLLDRIARIDGDFRVRLSSIEATEATRELLGVMADYREKVCPHLHICLQSGSDAVLRRMRRRWPVRLIVDRCRLASQVLDCPALTTDVIVGFPGETDEDFEWTCRAVRDIGFSKIHVFPFSPRRGTLAAEMPDQVPERVKRDRAEHLSAIGRELRARYFGSLVGRRLRVLVEAFCRDRGDRAIGTSCRYAPVALPRAQSHLGELVDVTVRRAIGDQRVEA